MLNLLRRFTVIVVLLATTWAGMGLTTTRVTQAQGDDTIKYNEPAIVTLNAGQNVTRYFNVLAGDSFELKLSRLAQFTYSAVLVDPNQSATPLSPGTDGNATYLMEQAPVGGQFSLLLQATDGNGDMLIQVNSDAIEPLPLAFGQTIVDLVDAPLRYALVPPPDAAATSLTVDVLLTDQAAPPNLPSLILVDEESGTVAITVQQGMVPFFTTVLPAQRSFILAFEPDEVSQQVLVTWEAGPAPSSDPGSTAGGPGPSPSTTGTCQIYFSGAVNVRSGPGTAYEPPLGQVAAGTTLPVTGRNADYTWYQVNYSGQPGWIAGTIQATEIQGDCTAIGVASAPPPPTGPTYTYTPTLDGPTYTYTPTYTPSPTYTPGGPTLTATFTPSVVPPTATFTSTPTPSYTPTTAPAQQIAPEDPRFNNPLNIPLDNTASVLDFVSCPGGDTEDRVRWDITGMNPNASLSGGTARLVISASCFGTGTEHISFFTGGQTYSCGQTLVDREVTYDSRTGQVTITAIGGTGTYVQWVLTGTATRTN